MALFNIVEAMKDSPREFETIPYLRRLVELQPESGQHAFKLANLLSGAGRTAEALFYYRQALAANPRHQATISNYLLALNYADGLSVDYIAAEHFRLGSLLSEEHSVAAPVAPVGNPQQPLRIAYLSGDFHTHPDGKTLAPVMAAHDRRRHVVFAYSDGKKDDAWTAKARASCDVFRAIAEITDDALLQQIRDDRIDVLIETRGHMGGHNRFGVLARRAAPVQIAFLGYPNTTGVRGIDYRLTDEFCDPVGRTEHLHSEKLVRLKRGFLCFQPPVDPPPLDADPAARNGRITFGSFNNPAKVTPAMLRTWAGILDGVRESRLVVKYLGRFASDWLCEQWRAAFASGGVDPRRLQFSGGTSNLESHWTMIGGVDVALDPFPYQGTHTTLESLMMGVPVLTLMGETAARRASSGLLLRLGLEDLVTQSVDEYVERGVALAADRERRLRLRTGLRERFLGSEICDVPGYVAELESVCRQLSQSFPACGET